MKETYTKLVVNVVDMLLPGSVGRLLLFCRPPSVNTANTSAKKHRTSLAELTDFSILPLTIKVTLHRSAQTESSEEQL